MTAKATYYIESEHDPKFVAEQIAKEQSAGHSRSWEGISAESQIRGRAWVIEVIPEEPRGPRLPLSMSRPENRPLHKRCAAKVVIEYNGWDGEDGIVNLLNTVAGEPQHLGVVAALRLEDIDLAGLSGPEFTGPEFGASWFLRNTAEASRALICAPIKPSTGLLAEEAARLAYEAAFGGATIVKDDELAFSTRRSPSPLRVRAVARAVRNAEQDSSERKIYLANAIGIGGDLRKNAEALVAEGADCLLVAPSLQGIDIIPTMRRWGLQIPLVSHNLFQTHSSRVQSFGISLALWCMLQRSVGADGIVLPSAFGSFGFNSEETRSCLWSCVQRTSRFSSTLAMHSGSISILNAEKLLSLDSQSVPALTAGSSIFDHPSGPRAGAAALRTLVSPGWSPPNGDIKFLAQAVEEARQSASQWIIHHK